MLLGILDFNTATSFDTNRVKLMYKSIWELKNIQAEKCVLFVLLWCI